jgi:hypothetical protein
VRNHGILDAKAKYLVGFGCIAIFAATYHLNAAKRNMIAAGQGCIVRAQYAARLPRTVKISRFCYAIA